MRKEEYPETPVNSRSPLWRGRRRARREQRLLFLLEQNARWVKEAQETPSLSELMAGSTYGVASD